MKRLFIVMLCVIAQAQAANSFEATVFNTEETTEQTETTGTRDCQTCSKPKCGGCTTKK